MGLVTPERWYMALWVGVLIVVLAFAWVAGPHIVARGIVLAENSK